MHDGLACGGAIFDIVRSLEVEAGLLAGDLADRLGPPHVQRLLGPAGGQDGGFVGDPGLQVQGVGEVELSVDPGGAGEGDLGVLDREVPAIGCSTALFFGFGGHEPADGVGDEPVDLGGTDPVREGCDLGVHEPSGLYRTVRGSRGRSAGPATRPGHRPGPGPRCAGGGGPARPLRRGRPCRSRWAARPRARTRPRRTPRPGVRRVRRPRTAGRRSGRAGPRRGSTPPGADRPR